MFGNKDNKKESKSNIIVPQSSSHALNSVVEGTVFEGDIKSDSDIRIDGKLIGSLDCAGKVIIGPKGAIDGDIRCNNALVEGSFSGLLSVQDTLTVNQSAKITGDINTDKLVVHSGAVFNVSCSMGSTANKPGKKDRPTKVPLESPAKEELISFTENPISSKS